jgi:hypothetical protein
MTRKQPTKPRARALASDGELPGDELTVPALERWRDSCQRFRNELDQRYNQGEPWQSDAEFCKAKGLNRSQFSRVMQGTERPSPRIITALREEFPGVYKECQRHWVRSTDDERDLANSASERFLLPHAFLLTDWTLHQMSTVFENLRVYPENMLRNLENTRGLPLAERYVSELTRAGMGRQETLLVVRELLDGRSQNAALGDSDRIIKTQW